MAYSYECPNCNHKVPPTVDRCTHCGHGLPPPNVRAAEAPAETAALERRYKSATRDLTGRGLADKLADFELALKSSRAVVARSANQLQHLATSENNLHATFYQLAEADVRVPSGENWDRRRQEADQALFSGYVKNIRFAALSLNEYGLASFGNCFISLRTNMIADRATAMEENSVLFSERHRSRQGTPQRTPNGYRSTWPERHKICVAKLFKRIDDQTKAEEYSEITLRGGATSEDDEFVEIHIWGTFSVHTIEEVVLKTREIRREGIIIRDLENKLKRYGVKVNRWMP